ncbi:MAG: hypothetical protein KGV50_00340 [Gammaproteobacteria bacterium]|nr:hypothetical protein [Gammaproteobacteria bacterium]
MDKSLKVILIISGIALVCRFGLSVYEGEDTPNLLSFFTVLPKCDDSAAKDIMVRFLEETSDESNLDFVDLNNLTQVVYNEKNDIRYCKGKLYMSVKDTSTTMGANVTYNIIWANKDKGLFKVINFQKSIDN